MKVIGYSRLSTEKDLAGAIVPNGSGILMKSFDPSLKSFVASYLTFLGNGFLSSVPAVESSKNGARLIRVKPVDWKQPKSFAKAADRLTYHPANQEKLVFRQMDLDEKMMKGALLLGSQETRCNLLEVTRNPKPKCSCFCGREYRVDKKICPSCLGENPLGQALGKHGREISSEIRVRFDKDLQKRMESTLGEMKTLVKRLKEFSIKTQKAPELPSEGDEKLTARALIRYWESVFNFHGINKKQIESFSHLREKKYAATVLSASIAAGGLRAAWAPSSVCGWMPDKDFQKSVMLQLGGIWKQPIMDVREAYLKIFKAAALYRPIEKSYRNIADRSFLGDLWHSVGKPILIAASAVKTFGATLVLKASIMLMKSEEERQRHETFAAALTDAALSAEKAVVSLVKAERAENVFFSSVSRGFGIHMQNLIFDDYAKASPNLHRNLVVGILSELCLPTPWVSSLVERQTTPATLCAKIKYALNPNSFSGVVTILVLITSLVGVVIWLLNAFLD
jgi:hypothetical protein